MQLTRMRSLRRMGLGHQRHGWRHRAVGGEPKGMSSRAYARRRAVPRRRVRQRVGPSRVRWDRIGRVALVLVLFGVMVSYLNPAVNLFDAWRNSHAGREKLADLKQQNAALHQQLDSAQDPITMEREARKLGMVKPGEQAYVVHGLGD
jgi:cell division protein FtsB